LFVATGFTGFGVMRAAGLARRLAVGILKDRWDDLAPADPGRFPTPDSRFDPRPAFPLDTTAEAEGAVRRVQEYRPPAWREIPPFSEEVSYRLVESPFEVDRLRLPGLSEWFGPFLPLFMKDALRTGGQVVCAEIDGEVRGVHLQGSSETVGSLFTGTRSIAEHFLSQMGPHGTYSERPWLPGGTPIDVLAADLRDWPGAGTIRNVVRIAQPEDLPALRTLVREVSGPGEDSWFDTLPRPEETVFLCEIDHRVVGMSGLTRVGIYARGHSFLVHPRYRGLGIGTDLLLSRMMWLARTGGQFVVSEIYDGNAASLTAAAKAGMAVVGRMYHYRPNGPR
jgi:GNAT superfamily N-acetyltransferase